ncbi:phosphocholine-specific phospholipase C [Novosphingobium album (ex Liu et al. 2023)]|uniref:phospholipase C n=1 Tax=Novosphingobium album (ex Liu et al. 2023) TaxID=3031130 RepID=A0ABT5WX52_9SPHN|nr:phospholipase C, phosphocholine-specific [Novosphingobium album (ex Liu et al. 2023)]MDE8654481.1 phospholipase C, phosphocholine-specific [Novosphingobium album (ex Liu et al. 2023)]
MTDRRSVLTLGAGLAAAVALPGSIRRALAIPADSRTGTIRDVQHVVILMQENRSFDHYFGTMRGVRGFGDRHLVPLASGKPTWFQSDGKREIPPYHLNTATTSALRVPDTPHSYNDTQAPWNQGKFGFWPKYKTEFSMGHYQRADIPFQFALAEAFTICDGYHCSVTAGTDPNRIVFWSGSSANPRLRAQGINCTDADSEPDNLRCWVKGTMPDPGYTYNGTALTWPTIPDVLEAAGISWRIYQDPNDNFTGAMHGCLAFDSFRTAKPGSPIYEKGMRHWSLEDLAEDARKGTLPQVSWVLPPDRWSEHPGPSSPAQGAEFTAQILDALTANPETWSRTVFFLTFDENDGFFDHVPAPAPPSFNIDGSVAGGATFNLDGEYFSDPERKHLYPEDIITGTVRPFGLGPRVPMYVVSPWSKGGWVSSQVFDHTSVGQFLEKRFGVTIPGISRWHRAMCGDMLSAFDFASPNDPAVPPLPDTRGSVALVKQAMTRPRPVSPNEPEKLFQEAGTRLSRALPYVLHVDARTQAGVATLHFVNEGTVGVTFHVYDKHHLDRIPRRYAVEAGKSLDDHWTIDRERGLDLVVLGPNGFMRSLTADAGVPLPTLIARYDAPRKVIELALENHTDAPVHLALGKDAYGLNATRRVPVIPGGSAKARWLTAKSHGWYDFTVETDGLAMGFAGRLEDGKPTLSDPLMHT